MVFILFLLAPVVLIVTVVLLFAFADEYWYVCCAGVWIVFIWVALLFYSHGGV